MRHTGMYVVELEVGIGKGGESCRKEGEEDCRGEERTNMCDVGDKCVGRT